MDGDGWSVGRKKRCMGWDKQYFMYPEGNY